MAANPLFKHTLDALDRIFEVKDDPARVASPDLVDGTARDWAELSDQEKRRTVEHWLLCHNKKGEEILAEIMLNIDMFAILANFAQGDDAASGELFKREFMKLGHVIENDASYVL